MVVQPYVFTRGETVSVALENMDGAEVTDFAAGLKRRDSPFADPKGAVLAYMTAEARQSLGDGLGGGWLLSLTPAQSLALTPGFYALDARLTIGEFVEITDTVTIQIKAGVMESAR
ncbi:hypothetical protein [Brevundimonas albigilva]|jgi:hypothetical protein|uniref:Uncharacterized protein n=1 Tax=Brevundimonas albigilva TaxID=1312364 RepID=A0ABY4SSV5_9CAUL|nr:hypothetical protein [Brevundimonas albigilva]URI15918.1 hypothetical protein M8231_02700 [Brevundimonas albigilva]